MSERERFEAWARGLAPESLPLRKDASGNYWSEETDTAWDAWQAALADRPEPAQPVAPPEYFTSIQESRQWTQCGPVAWHVSFNKGQTWTVYEYDPTGKVAGDPIVMPLVYAAQPSHPAPSETLVPECIEETGCKYPVACNATQRCTLARLTAPSEAGAERQERALLEELLDATLCRDPDDPRYLEVRRRVSIFLAAQPAKGDAS